VKNGNGMKPKLIPDIESNFKNNNVGRSEKYA
jgi:hypothetical protein